MDITSRLLFVFFFCHNFYIYGCLLSIIYFVLYISSIMQSCFSYWGMRTWFEHIQCEFPLSKSKLIQEWKKYSFNFKFCLIFGLIGQQIRIFVLPRACLYLTSLPILKSVSRTNMTIYYMVILRERDKETFNSAWIRQ